MLPPANSLAFQDDTERFYRDFAAEEYGRRIEKKFKDEVRPLSLCGLLSPILSQLLTPQLTTLTSVVPLTLPGAVREEES